MSEVVRNKAVVERLNRYENYRKTVMSSGRSFTEKLEEKASSDESKRTERSRNTTEPQTTARKADVTLGRSKKISQKHAKRLASYAPFIEEAARKHNVPVELICGVILQESGGRSDAVSHCGARGLMQLMPGTARRFGVKNSFDAKQNIDGGTEYLSWLLKRFDGDIELALAGYNAGEGNVEKYGNKIPPFKETQAYVPNVLGYTQSMVEIFQATIARTEVPEYARRA